MMEPEEFDIAKNIREIEMLKAGLLSAVSDVFRLMLDGGSGREAMGEALAGVMVTSLDLAGRMGVTTEDLDRRVTRMLRAKRMNA